MSYDIFDKYYKKLEEAAIKEKMSPEDEHDSMILQSIIDKTYERTNAKLTPEEKEILDKYGLTREHQQVVIPGITKSYNWSDEAIDNLEGGNIRERGHFRKYPGGYISYRREPTHHDRSQVNYADMARKRGARDQARLDRIKGDKITQYKDAQHDLDYALHNRDLYQREIDTADEEYFKALQKAKKAYDDAVAAANRRRDSVDTYYTPARDKALKSIENIYNRFKK